MLSSTSYSASSSAARSRSSSSCVTTNIDAHTACSARVDSARSSSPALCARCGGPTVFTTATGFGAWSPVAWTRVSEIAGFHTSQKFADLSQPIGRAYRAAYRVQRRAHAHRISALTSRLVSTRMFRHALRRHRTVCRSKKRGQQPICNELRRYIHVVEMVRACDAGTGREKK